MSSPYSQYPNEPIAIIGTGCRLPGGADSASKLWELLRNPRDVSCKIGGAGRFNLDRFYHPEGGHNGTTHTQRGYLLRENPRHFDAKFFSIPPGEAEVIDPQQRMLLEVVYEALESAGLPIHSLSGSDTACYVGIMCQDFFTVQAQDLLSVPKYAVTGIAASNASSRVSYFFDWHGPSMTIDTACSSSMVCVNEAVQALRSGTSRVAVACGTNLLLAPFMYVSLSAVGMVSPTGRCHMWDERADGYARGEGVGALVLKTLRAAIEDGDDVVCIIREIGLNHDGRTKGLTMPSAEAQAALIRETYRRARLDPTSKSDRCQFFEAHGTGTPTGDPKEASALNQAFFPNQDTAEGELLVGSIKTVVGHTEGTAGIAGILKAALAVQHGVVLPNMLFNKLNPALEPFTRFLRIPTACEPWPDVPAGQPRRASINSFGFGGANAHCIIESYEPERRSISEVNGSVISNGSVADEIQVNGFHSNGTYCNGTAHTNGSTLGGYSTDIAAINGAITDGPTAHGLETPTTNGVCTGIASTNDAITNGSTTNGIEPPTWNSTSADTATTNGTTTTVNHQPSDSDNPSAPPNPKPLIPLAFSAACLNSLISQVTQTLEYLEQNPSIPLSSLAHTLSTRRSALSLRLPIYASSVPDLREKTQAKLAADDSTTTHSVAALQAPPSILGIFTGQGAQWMGMGAALFAANPLARDILDRLDAALASLPACHRPSWTLAELLSPVTSKLHHAHSMTEAAVAQPACTAVQIVLVDLLRAAGVRFAAVVGHSSGEIAAAYAAGFLSAEDAIRVAYYRGFFAKLAAGPAGEKGAMLAAGTDVEDAEELCLVDDMLGRLCVAAHNSPSSVTLSGDIDAVELARDVFEDEQKFARLLRVDTAYHSAHMRSCSGPYLKAMRDVGIRQLMPGPDRPRWFSSVYDAEMTPEGATKKGLDGRYWVDNMLRPVLFYPALKTCLSSSDITFNFALEVGPHPALQGPAKDCIQDVTQQDMAYSGTLRRGSDDAEAFADALGSLWARFGPSHVNLGGFQKKCLPDVDVRLAAALVSKLPKYPWTHEKEYWAESRKSKIHSSDPGEFHDLLGLREPDGLADEVRWRHILSVNDLRWLAGHTLQGQVVFPTTGYICMFNPGC
jgi:acyl transferase domain-containing protein